MIITLVGGLASCGGDDVKTEKNYSFLFTENPVMVGSTGGEVSTMIITDVTYTPASQESWITDIVIESAELIRFKVAANTESASRDGKILFYIDGTDFTEELTVRQAASAGGFSVSETSIEFPAVGAEEEITVSSQSSWEVESAPDWLTATKKNAFSLILETDVNYAGKTMSGAVVLKSSSETATITVSQKNDNSLFLGADTKMGKRFAYNCGDLVTRVTTDKSYTVADGVDVLEIKYMSSHTGSSLPYYAYIYEIDLSKVTILATCKDDDPSNIKKTEDEVTGTATIRAQFTALKNNRTNLTVYGGINGDFCYGDGSAVEKNSLLHGPMYKDDVCLKSSFDGGNVCTMFAIMKDGTARIIKQSAYNTYKDDIAEAIGGRQQIMDGGIVTTVKNGKQDPRTAIGVSSDRNKVIMIAIDGRQASHSNGADYPEMGKMFKAMGAYNAINLDGGGSTTFVVKDDTDATGFSVKNKPSDKSERAVPNGLAIVSK